MAYEDDALEATGFVIGLRPEKPYAHAGHVLRFEPQHPMAWKDGTVFEHRWVWYEAHGEIPLGFVVHHRNGVKQDNRLENLELMPMGAHSAMHARERWDAVSRSKGAAATDDA